MIKISGTRTMQGPLKFLEDWERNDKTKEQSTIEYITAKMQAKYPGNYRIARRLTPCKGWEPYHIMVFDTPADETMFILKWS